MVKNIFSFFNDNALSTLVLSFAFTWLIRCLDKKDKEKADNLDKVYRKGQFRIDRQFDGKVVDKLKLAYINFEKKSPGLNECVYDERIKNDYCTYYNRIYFENIGDCNIEEIYLVATNRQNTTLCTNEQLDTLVENRISNSVVELKQTIKPSESVLIGILVLDNQEFGFSDFKVYYRDTYGNFYFQNVSLADFTVDNPHKIHDLKFLNDIKEFYEE